MKGRNASRLRWVYGVALGLSAVASAWADKPSDATTPLFDGKSLSGWSVQGDCEVVVDDGTILLKGGNGWLRSDLAYTDFELHIEWKAAKKADFDSGVYIRTGRDGKPFPKPAYQINLLQGKEGNIGALLEAVSTGLVKDGEWNAFDVTVVGDTVSLKINGHDAYKTSGIKEASGHIGLQCEEPKGGQFRFRNITIKELGYKSLFNGTDLAGWEGAGAAAEQCWRVEGGVLECTGSKGPWLRWKEELGDFNLRLEYQVSDGGNSGLYVRVPANGNHHRESDSAPPAGFEVQILDDSAPKHRNLKPYQYTGSVYDIAPATEHVCKPVGEWNTLELKCQGQHIVVTHNGVVVVDCDEEHFPLIKRRQTKGFLGLQNHSTVVKFRNLRVKELAAQ